MNPERQQALILLKNYEKVGDKVEVRVGDITYENIAEIETHLSSIEGELEIKLGEIEIGITAYGCRITGPKSLSPTIFSIVRDLESHRSWLVWLSNPFGAIIALLISFYLPLSAIGWLIEIDMLDKSQINVLTAIWIFSAMVLSFTTLHKFEKLIESRVTGRVPNSFWRRNFDKIVLAGITVILGFTISSIWSQITKFISSQ